MFHQKYKMLCQGWENRDIEGFVMKRCIFREKWGGVTLYAML